MSELTLFDQPSTQLMTIAEAEQWRARVGSAAKELRLLLDEGYQRQAWKALRYINWTDCLQDLANKFGFSENYVWRLHTANQTERLLDHGQVGQLPERTLRALNVAGMTDDDKREAWRIANETAPNGKVTAVHVTEVVRDYQDAREEYDEAQAFDDGDDPLWEEWVEEENKSAIDTLGYKNWDIDTYREVAFDRVAERAEEERKKARGSNFITLEEWNNNRPLAFATDNGSKFNETNDNIEWAAWSWNPVTGCLHDCAYCYARDIANRFFEQKFAPSFLPERLNAPANTKSPNFENEPDPIRRMGLRNVFVCSMADLFGKWVPAEWIEAVLQQARDNPQWTFLFLTKFPIRMAEFDFPSNTWIGTTVDKQYTVERAEKAFRKIRAGGYEGVAWLSCEPMMERLTFTSLDMFDWVVVGGSSKSTQTPEFKPPFEWIAHLWNQAKAHDLPVYMKTNLGIEQRVREYPQ